MEAIKKLYTEYQTKQKEIERLENAIRTHIDNNFRTNYYVKVGQHDSITGLFYPSILKKFLLKENAMRYIEQMSEKYESVHLTQHNSNMTINDFFNNFQDEVKDPD